MVLVSVEVSVGREKYREGYN